MYVIASMHELSAVIGLAPMTRRVASCAASLAITLLATAFLYDPATVSARAAAAASQSSVSLALQCPNIGYGIACAPQFQAVSGGTDTNGCSLPPRCVPNTVASHLNRHVRRLRLQLQRES